MTYVDFTFQSVTTGGGPWRLDTRLLKDEDYIQSVTNFWTRWRGRKAHYPTILEWWDAGKSEIQSLSKRKSRKLAQREGKFIRSLRKRLQNAINGCKLNLISSLNAKLKAAQAEQAQQHFAYLKERWVEEGEKCTNYFLSKHTARVKQAIVNQIQTKEGLSSDTVECI